MRGLLAWPSTKQIAKSYLALQRESTLSSKSLATYSQWARLDPRLAELLCTYMAKTWKKINPVEFNFELKKLPWPQSLGVVLEQVYYYYGITNEEKSLFQNWAGCVMSDISAASNEQYFIGLRGFSGKEALKDVVSATRPFLKWGYFGREVLKNKALLPQTTMLSKKRRLILLAELMREKDSFTVSDYMERLGGHVSRRQAERDLKENKKLRSKGQTRGRLYFRKN